MESQTKVKAFNPKTPNFILIQNVFLNNKNGGTKGFTKAKLTSHLMAAHPEMKDKKSIWLNRMIRTNLESAIKAEWISNSGTGFVGTRFKLTPEAKKNIAKANKPKKVVKKATIAKKKAVKKVAAKKISKSTTKKVAPKKKPATKKPKSPVKKIKSVKSRVDKGKTKSSSQKVSKSKK
jgi:hypothetical protein